MIELLSQYNCVPVFLPPELYALSLSGFSSSVLWPLLHNQIPERHAGGKGGDGALVGNYFAAYAPRPLRASRRILT